jgi:pimeloyl-ACP methyl ester carboxylesterase
VYGASSVAGLERLVSVELAALRRRRVLFLGRDGGAPPPPLAQAFAQVGAEVVVSSADGYGDLGEDPYTASLKPAVTEAILGWLGGERLTGTAGPPRGAASVRIGDVVERPWVGPGGLSGILCEPASGATSAWTLLLNAGGVRRCGPNRLWTRAARALAARGRPSLRFDVRDVGDSDGVDTPHDDLEAMYGEGTISDVVAGWDAVTALGATTVDAVGLCSGAYFGIQLAARRKVRRAVLFNGPALVWNDDARASGVTSHILVSLLDGRRWRRLLSGKLDAVFIARSIVDKGRITVRDRLERLAGRPPRDEVAELVAGVQRRGTELLFVSSEGDPSQPYLASHVPEAARPPLVVIPAVDHTIRPAWAHSRVLSLIVDGAPARPIG